ncbi:MAG: hypothetical protein HC819_18170 [Cyclobacteriaceae bacterium]|nr:hypothetical protein [Cyclobacteriaceae bacterium]
MKATLLKLISASFVFLLVFGMAQQPLNAQAPDSAEVQQDSAVLEDNSSSFNDSVQFDDMEPIFYEAAEDDAVETAADNGSNIWMYVGIAVVLLIVLVVLKKVSKK